MMKHSFLHYGSSTEGDQKILPPLSSIKNNNFYYHNILFIGSKVLRDLLFQNLKVISDG